MGPSRGAPPLRLIIQQQRKNQGETFSSLLVSVVARKTALSLVAAAVMGAVIFSEHFRSHAAR